MRSRMNSVEPMSTPRVGWVATSSEGSRANSRPTTNFCWFPPESDRAVASASGGLTSYSSMMDSACSRATPQSSRPPLANGAACWLPSTPLPTRSKSITSPRSWRSSGTYAIPASMRR